MDDIFEICDFTTQTPYETFVAAFDQLLRETVGKDNSGGGGGSGGGTDDGTDPDGQQQHQQRTDVRFGNTTFDVRYHREVVDSSLADCQDFPPRAHCIVRWFGERRFLLLTPRSAADTDCEDRIRLLLSALSLALTATGHTVPVFCLLHRKRRLYWGVRSHDDRRTVYRMAHLSATPPPLRHLSGLTTLFRRQTGLSSGQPIKVSARVTFSLMSLTTTLEAPPLQDFGLELPDGDNPLKELQLAAVWQRISDQVIIDSEVHSDLTPNNAETWTLRAVRRSEAKSALAIALSRWRDFSRAAGAADQPFLDRVLGNEAREVFDALSERQSQRMSADEWSQRNSVRNRVNRVFESTDQLATGVAKELFNCVVQFTEDVGTVRAFWREVCVRLRKHWESRTLLPGVAEHSTPDWGRSLLHQKLQYLQNCIESEVKRMRDAEEDVENDSEDEFFDAADDDNKDAEDKQSVPEGRSEPLRDLTLLSDPTQSLYVPETQSPPPVTSEMATETQTLIQRLAADGASAAVRARVQSAQLVSDMEAFLAANPGAEFADFVRWHSPRDFVDSTGQLSDRMSAEDNVWRELWRTARPVPVRRQKPLFDSKTEAEKTLHTLSTEVFDKIAEMVWPELTEIIGERFKRRRGAGVGGGGGQHLFNSTDDEIEREESRLDLREALARTLGVNNNDDKNDKETDDLLNRLVAEPEVAISSAGRTARRSVHRVFVDPESGLWPAPVAKELILRAVARRRNSYSRESQQRMYCLLTAQEVRVATSETTDNTF
ncbi:rab3 GTPase-activating protein catalytic subunit-like [Oppia nitens]|uniref:rab3 GTPase-activating protein catalytic subunit-like n=1 Tax=Oppia nitens TaxID=1686743 RepID=UPI0023DCD7AE|nr:rab3 GTPase-activating protein catalytic subunit-like [Oppia nitens]